ncbi:PREDICTED: zinc finger protein 37-like [Trachymyrmex cornetzi]|uniref:zinc finger protein 37-like n=1 Tax=Trachymyrmex cornetzi TaxID=471704 RepID=UPI00084F3BB1|nr:PREDICTED: zinc finger protein 37-like [Trachymyrmex cornetzi]
MEGDDGPLAISNKPTVIEVAEEAMRRLDVLVCGQCHSVFHFVEKFQEHCTKEGACSKTSRISDTNDIEQKAQVWAFLSWKDTQVQDSSDKEASNDWILYQKWCKMDTKVQEAWETVGKTVQTFTKINDANMQDTLMQSNTNVEGAKPIIVRKVRNRQPEETGGAKKDSAKSLETKTQKNESMEIEVDKKEKPRLKPSIKPKIKPGKATIEEDADLSNEEYIVNKILAKRFNIKRRCSEYLIKWKGYPHENYIWVSAEAVAASKSLLDKFERSLAKQKESKAAQQKANTKVVRRVSLPLQKSAIEAETSQPGPSTVAQAGRPMRSNKSKEIDQVKQWCGSINDEENELLDKRRIDDSESDSEGGSSTSKRTTDDTNNDDEWTGESEDERLLGRSDVIQRAFNRANAQSNGSNKTSVSSTDLATSLGLQSSDVVKSSQLPVLVTSAKGVKVDPKQMPNRASSLCVMSRKDGIIKSNSSSSGKLVVKGSSTTHNVIMVQNRDNTNVIAYRCKTCRNTFQCKSYLRRHLLIHSGEKPYQCKFCKKVFNQISSLNRHKKKMHFNVRNNCNDCKKGFINEQDLNNHLVTKHSYIDGNPFKCETCPATFKRLKVLKQHTKTHAGKNPYICDGHMSDVVVKNSD